MQPGVTRRRAVTGGLAVIAAPGARAQPAPAPQRIILNDASRLNPTPVLKNWRPRLDKSDVFIEALRAELKEAAAAGRPAAVGAARHSMGGQSLPKDGVAMTFNGISLEPDTARKTYRVNAGARWSEVIAALDPLGFSPAVMQSNHDFGVASTFSVNAHGWPAPYGPFGTTVRSLRLMLADGSVVECSRTQNPELFGLAMGGYGLLGVIIDLVVDMTPNLLLAPRHETMAAEEFGEKFARAVETDASVKMAYGRLNVAKKSFFEKALMVTYRATPDQPARLPATTTSGAMTGLSNKIYRAQIGSEAAKNARWFAETVANPRLGSGRATRNTLMNEPVSNLPNLDRRRTDILHEYFVPPNRLSDFIGKCRAIIPPARAEFLNITLRYVGADPVSVLAFAPAARIAGVMSFSQEITPEGETDMIETTEKLIDAVTDVGGAFYLPYRLHARRDQVRRAYANAATFVERKRHYDPKLLFRNAMWDAYFA